LGTYYAGLSGRNDVPPADLNRKLADRLADISPLLSDGQRVLEIGCAEGRLGARVKGLARVEYTGVEPSGDAEAAVRVLDRVVRGTSADLTDGPYDLLLAFHVLEHIPDVATEVAHWRRLLGVSGTALLEVPEETGHRLLSWDAHVEHLHYFTAASLAALCERSGFQPTSLTSGHFESVVYPDSLRLLARRRIPEPIRREALVARFRSFFPGPFAVYGIGGDFRNYVEPLLGTLLVTALIDSNPDRQGARIGDLTVAPFDPTRHGSLPLLVSSVRFKAEISAWLQTVHHVSRDRIVGLDDIYGGVPHIMWAPGKK
jgi:SAM-dependent methyltransferase